MLLSVVTANVWSFWGSLRITFRIKVGTNVPNIPTVTGVGRD